MNKTIENQLNHRTIREFKDKPIEEEKMQQLFEVANHTATSTGMQSYSIIRITDQELKNKLSEVCNQEYVRRAPEVLVFIVDVFRNAEIARAQGEHLKAERDMDRFFQGFTDGVLAAQNMTVAAESMGLGAMYLGSVLNDSAKVVELLNLPELTFPIFGMGLGYPNQEPQLKPRMPVELKVFENEYKKSDDIMADIAEYDEEMQTYYDLRDANNRVDSFSNQVVTRLKSATPKRSQLLRVVKDQGFDFQLEDE